MRLSPALAATLCLVLGGLAARPLPAASVPDADHTFYGLPTDNGALLETGVVTIRPEGSSTVLAKDTLGGHPELGGRYVLRVPMELGFGPRTAGTARPGDPVELYIGDVLSGVGNVGDPGEATVLDLEIHYGEPPQVWVEAAYVTEGDSGTTGGEVEVRLSRRLSTDVHFTATTVDGTAIQGLDYVAAVQPGVIAAGETSTVVPVAILGETLAEPTESFELVLGGLIGGVVFRPLPDGSRGAVSIVADDVAWIGSVEDDEVLEGDGDHLASALVTLVAGIPTHTSALLDVGWELVAGTATAGSDFVLASGVIQVDTSVICPGVGSSCGEIPVQILADDRREGDEMLTVRLTSVSAGEVGRAEATITLIDDEHYLRYRGVERSNPGIVDGLASPVAVTLSPDGAFVYAASTLDDAVSVFSRDATTGVLTFVEAQVDGLGGVSGLDGASAVAMSPDGLFVYAAGALADAVAVFARNPTTGRLSFSTRYREGEAAVSGLDGVAAIAVSPDGNHVYTAARNANAVAVFSRNSSTGALSFQSKVANGSGLNLLGANALLLSPSGGELFVTAGTDSTLTVFSRNPSTGVLTASDAERDGINDPSDVGGLVDGLNGARAVAVSPDGTFVYVAGELDSAVSVFSFNAGELSFVERKRDGVSGTVGLAGASALVMHPNGRYLFVAARGGSPAEVTILSRQANGRLTWFETRRNGELEDEAPESRVAGLAGAIAMAGVPGTADHIYVSGQIDAAIATFEPDNDGPLAPSLHSTTHTANTYSSQPVIGFEWSGAHDSGLGMSGYAYVVDGLATTVPPLPVQQLHGQDPHGYTTGSLADGVWHFHLRACDVLDQCTATEHLGPFGIDTVSPLAPTNLVRTNGLPATTLDVGWTAAVDPGAQASGVAGYVHVFSQSSTASCDGPVTLPAAAIATSSGPIADGFWYFHICAVDQAGLRSPIASLGPEVVDSGVTLKLTHVTAVAPPDDGEIDGLEVMSATQIRIDFNRPLAETGVGSALDLGNYQLVDLGGNGSLDTAGCGAAGGDDARLDIPGVSWLPQGNRLYLRLNSPTAIPAGRYALRVCDSLRDFVDHTLDGDADDTAGGDFVRTFEVWSTNLLTNPNIDEGTNGWTLSPAADITAQQPDAHEAPTSGSLRLENNSGGAGAVLGVSQCVGLELGQGYALSGRARVDNADGGQVLVAGTVEFFAQADCSGPATGGVYLSSPVTADTGGAWQALELPSLSALGPFARVRFAVTVGPEAGQSWVGVDLDELVFAHIPSLFSSSFELGSTGEWSGVAP